MRAAGSKTRCTADPGWRQLRSRLLSRLRADLADGLVDPDMIDLLVSMNSCSKYVTSSSCSGRIAVIAAEEPGDKLRGGVVARWHRRVGLDELLHALRLASTRHVWVSVQPPMLNVYVCNFETALEAVRVFHRAGFKYASVRPTGSGYPLVQIMSTERIDVPVIYNGRVVVNLDESLVRLLNEFLALGKAKLDRMKRAASALLASTCGYEDATLS